eukprot:2550945-Prymnesium_polylepis.1
MPCALSRCALCAVGDCPGSPPLRSRPVKLSTIAVRVHPTDPTPRTPGGPRAPARANSHAPPPWG